MPGSESARVMIVERKITESQLSTHLPSHAERKEQTNNLVYAFSFVDVPIMLGIGACIGHNLGCFQCSALVSLSLPGFSPNTLCNHPCTCNCRTPCCIATSKYCNKYVHISWVIDVTANVNSNPNHTKKRIISTDETTQVKTTTITVNGTL